jgi:serine/threonine-protein kinase
VKTDRLALEHLADSVADGQDVDWTAAESRVDIPDRRLVRHLRLVNSIASLYRSIPPEPDDAGPFTGSGDAPAAVAEPEGRRWGPLVVMEAIGRGASSEVFRAWDTSLQRDVALKLLHDGAVDGGGREAAGAHARLLQEARRMARINHRHVVQVHGAEEHDGQVGLWMELVRGESLERIVTRRGPFGAGEAIVIGRELCAALAAVHGAGLLHRDVKAQNVLRENGGRIVLMDFGTGEELRETGGTARMTGTPLYLAPEILARQPASVQSDIYSLGVLLFYLVTGQFPVVAASVEQLARAHRNKDVRRLRDLRPDLPSAFVTVVERSLSADPAARYRTAGEMETALREGGDRLQDAAPAAQHRPALMGRRMALAAALLALVATAVAAIVWSRGDRPDSSLAQAGSRRVAVLPLLDVSGASAVPYLADGLTDQLITTLGQVSALEVMSRASVTQARTAQQDLEATAKSLGAGALVEGTVAVVGAEGTDQRRVRVNARLIAAGGGVLWSRTFERPLGDVLTLQADVARAIVDGVRATLTPAENRRLAQTLSTNPAAERAYFLGLYHLSQLGADSLRAAVDAFRRATELDPNHALAYAGLARAHVTLGFMRATSHPEARALATGALARASALDAESSDVHEVTADLLFYYDWNWPGADAEYLKAIELNPSSARAHSQYARYLVARKRTAQAIVEAERAVALDPLSANAASTLALMEYYTRNYDKALASASAALRLDPRSAGVYFVLSRIHAARGAIPEAIEANERAIQLAGRAATGWRAHLLMLQTRSGQTAASRNMLRELEAEVRAEKGRLGPGQMAFVELALGNRDAALEWLERAAEDRDPDLLWIAVDPRVDPLRNEPRLQAIVARLGLS